MSVPFPSTRCSSHPAKAAQFFRAYGQRPPLASRSIVNSHSSATSARADAAPASHALTWRDALWLGVIVVIGINLRPLLTSISPLMTTIRAATGLSFYGASLLTSLPVVAMGIGAFGAGALTRTIGETRGVALGLLAIGLACGARWATAASRAGCWRRAWVITRTK